MADGIIFERLGVPAVSLVTDAFPSSSNAMARLRGAPGYRYAMVPHPLSSLTPEECRQRAGQVLPVVVDILGLEGDQAAAAEDTVGAASSVAVAEPASGSDLAEDLTEDRVREQRKVVEHYYAQGWADGLPVMPVTAATVAEFVDYVGRDPGEEIVSVAHLDRSCTVELAAIAAAMAGCQKEHFPVLLAAAEAMQQGETAMLQSTSGQAQLIIVNGPVRQRLGFNGAVSVFGPGHRANATVGRALRLISMNAFGIRPGTFDQSTQGTPGKYTFCIAENEEDSPWEPLHVERGYPGNSDVVTVHHARGTLHVENRTSNRPEEVLLTIADSMSYAGSAGGRACTVVMGPEHARLLDRHGWSKQQAKQFLWENWGRQTADLRRFGLYRGDTDGGDPFSRPVTSDAVEGEFLRFGDSPESILLVVAGANNAGVSTVIPAHHPKLHSTAFRSAEIHGPDR